MLYIKPEYREKFSDFRSLADFFKIQGPIARQTHNRKVMQFTHKGESFYVKLHFGLGWREIFKNWFAGRQPVYSARTEWDALIRLKEIGVSSIEPVGYGVVGKNPANIHSFLVTKDLGKLPDLEGHCQTWPEQPPHPREKRLLIGQVAEMARKMHDAGINHRDFYIIHFMLRALENDFDYPTFQLYLIDLHRAQTRTKVPYRWRVKDLGSLYFSALDIGLTRRDYLRFQYLYSGQTVSQHSEFETKLWVDIRARADKVYRKVNKKVPMFLL